MAPPPSPTPLPITQENGQRKWGPPAEWKGPPPPRGTEVFIGKLPRSLSEDALYEVFSKVGRIYELRLMVDYSGSNRGYCFITFAEPEEARRACEELNNFEIRPGQHIGVVMSVDNCRLFVGGIPRERTREEVLVEMEKLTEGVRSIILYPSANDKSKNRGFAFVEYSSHRAAAMARKKLSPGKVQLWGQSICVDWAEPEQEVDDETMSQVKILYVRNLMMSTTEDTIREHFEQFKPDGIERVKKIKDFAFVHYKEREDALQAMDMLNGNKLEGAELEVVLAKPPDRSLMRFVKSVQKGQSPVPWTGNVHQNIVAEATRQYVLGNGNGVTTGLDALSWAYNGAPIVDANLPMNGGSTKTSPEMLGPKVNPRGAAGMRGAGFQAFVNNQLRKNRRKGFENGLNPEMLGYPHLNPLLMQGGGPLWVAVGPPSPLLSPQFHFPFVPQPLLLTPKHRPVEQLEEICTKLSQLGLPQYETALLASKDPTGRDVILYVSKVVIPGLRDRHPAGFQADRAALDEESAKDVAAFTALVHLGYSSLPTTPPSPREPTIVTPASIATPQDWA